MTMVGASTGRQTHIARETDDWPTPKRIVVAYGFWIFLLSDIIMFAALFASYAVLVDQTAGGPTGRQLFDLRNAGIETALLLMSSFTCGLASIAISVRSKLWFHVAMAATCLLGLSFLALELREFASLIAQGAGPQRSAFLSAFFTVVGCHGLHVSVGILWLADDDGPGFRQGISCRHRAPNSYASRCSGMRSILYGLACSRSYI